MTNASAVLFAASGVGLLAALLQHLALRRHLRQRVAPAGGRPGVSVLKPLCGADDDLEANLASFEHLDYPCYEVLLGVRSTDDSAWPIALAATRRRPDRFRVVVQRGTPGLNPKVNQLVTLAREARHEILVVSDSNVRVRSGYLSDIAARLEDESVGLVTHLIVGVGARRLGSVLDGLQLAGSVSPGLVAAQRVAGRDLVVGKSMALRRSDLGRLGGFEAVKDVLAEDYVMGRMVPRVLGKRVAIAREPVENVSRDKGVREFLSRYARWAVLQRQVLGPVAYAAQVILNPVLLAFAAFALAPAAGPLELLGATCAAKIALEGSSARLLLPDGFRPVVSFLVPLKDLAVGLAWAYGLLTNRVTWRGNRLKVLPGTRLAQRRSDRADERALAPG